MKQFILLFFIASTSYALDASQMVNRVPKKQTATQKALFDAIERKDIETLQKILANDTALDLNISYCDHFTDGNNYLHVHWTPLRKAAYKNNIKIVQLLIDNGADVNEKLIFGLTLLLSEAFAGKKDVIKVLIQNGAIINIQGRCCERAIMKAVSWMQYDVIQLLVLAGAGSDIQKYIDNAPNTAVFRGVIDKIEETIEAAKKERAQYLELQEVAHQEIQRYIIPDLTNIVTQYAYGQFPEHFPRRIQSQSQRAKCCSIM